MHVSCMHFSHHDDVSGSRRGSGRSGGGRSGSGGRSSGRRRSSDGCRCRLLALLRHVAAPVPGVPVGVAREAVRRGAGVGAALRFPPDLRIFSALNTGLAEGVRT